MAATLLGLALAACAQGPGSTGGTAPPRAAAASAGPVGPGGAAVWNLRAGLNVAALSCRSTRGLARNYERLLSRHSELLAATYAAEQRRGGSGFDRQQTRLYNRFSNQRSPARYCETAGAVAQESSAMDSRQLVSAAPSLLNRLERELR